MIDLEVEDDPVRWLAAARERIGSHPCMVTIEGLARVFREQGASVMYVSLDRQELEERAARDKRLERVLSSFQGLMDMGWLAWVPERRVICMTIPGRLQ